MLEVFGKRLPSFETIARFAENLVSPEASKKPLAVAYYPNYDCNAQCDFCSQRENREDHAGKPEPDLSAQLEDIEMIRRDCPNIYLLGGEPTIHRGIMEILRKCSELDFDVVALNTNGIRFLPEALEYLNLLVFSLHSADPQKIAEMFGFGQNPHLGKTVLENLRKYAELAKDKEVTVVVNSVITAKNIQEIYGLAELCREIGAKLNIAPAIMPNGQPDAGLMDNPEYQQLIDNLLADRKILACSTSYLRKIRRFGQFSCTPQAIPAVTPDGNVLAPCPNVSDRKEVSIKTASGLNKAIRKGRDQYGEFDPEKDCIGVCHKTCYVEAAGMAGVVPLVRRFRALVTAQMPMIEEHLAVNPEGLSEEMTIIAREINAFFVRHYPFVEKLPAKEIEELEDETVAFLRNYFRQRASMLYETQKSAGNLDFAMKVIIDGFVQFFTRPFDGFFSGLETRVNRPFVTDFTTTREINRCERNAALFNAELKNRALNI